MSNLIDTFSHRLSYAIKIKDIRPVDISKTTGISKTNLSCYMSGKYEAKQDGVELLAEALNVNPVWLMGYDVPMDRNYEKDKIIEINVINLTTNEIINKIPFIYRTDVENQSIDNLFAIYANDNSMAHLLDENDIAILEKATTFSSGGTYLLKLKNGFPIIRKIIKTTHGIELQAMNMWNFPVQENLKEEDIEILGEVIRVENSSAFRKKH